MSLFKKSDISIIDYDESLKSNNVAKNIDPKQLAEWLQRIKEIEQILSLNRKPSIKYHDIWAQVNDVST